MQPGNAGSSVDPYVFDAGVVAATALAKRMLEQLAELRTINAPLLNALIALGRGLSMPGSEAAPTGKLTAISALQVPEPEPPRGNASPSSRLPRTGIAEWPKMTASGAALPSTQGTPARTPVAMLTRRHDETRPSHRHSDLAHTTEQRRTSPEPITGPSATTRRAGVGTAQLTLDDHVRNIKVEFEQETQPLSRIPNSGHPLHNQRRLPTAPVGLFGAGHTYSAPVDPFGARPTYDAPFVPERSDRAGDCGNEQIVPPETQVRNAGPVVSAPSSRPGLHNTDPDEMGKSHRMESEYTIDETPPSVRGTVFLDSASFGRWMVDHLTREIARPATGMTGFDPRITASYPGAPIGG